jgi:hypothetical protein
MYVQIVISRSRGKQVVLSRFAQPLSDGGLQIERPVTTKYRSRGWTRPTNAGSSGAEDAVSHAVAAKTLLGPSRAHHLRQVRWVDRRAVTHTQLAHLRQQATTRLWWVSWCAGACSC